MVVIILSHIFVYFLAFPLLINITGDHSVSYLIYIIIVSDGDDRNEVPTAAELNGRCGKF